MLGAVIKAITSPLGGAISAAAFAVTAGALLYVTVDGAAVQRELRGQVTSITADRDKYKRAYGVCYQNRLTLQGEVSRQNGEIDRLQTEGRLRTEAAERALAAERRAGEWARAQAAGIMAETIAEGDELAVCRRADEFLIMGAGDAR